MARRPRRNEVSLEDHILALRAADDRRYAEVATEREKALSILKEADTKALELAREGQSYRDEQANRLREQINSERGIYATKAELQATVRELMALSAKKTESSWAMIFSVIAGIYGLAATAGVVVTLLSR